MNILNGILIVLIVKFNILEIFCQSCENTNRNLQIGIDNYKIEREKGIFLTENGYIADDSEPFSIIFRLNDFLQKNMSTIFSNNEKLLKGTHAILNDYFREYTKETRPDAITENKFLNNVTECIPQELRCPWEIINITCNGNDKYRSFDGSCNNLDKPYQGAALTQYSRLDETTTFYDDHVIEIRKSITGEDLISPRTIIDKVLLNTYNTYKCERDYPNMGWLLFGQLITHDIAGSINNVHEKAFEPNDPPIRCCSQDYKKILPKSEMHPGCLPFPISPDDKFHKTTKLRCHNYIRSQTTLPNDCKLKAGQQINRVSHYLDLSVIYGSSDKKAFKLRLKQDGKLKTSDGNLLPKKLNCDTPDCYFTGDFRALQIPSLGLIHLIFLRLHNIIAENIGDHTPDWDDEKIFQEARRLNIAIYQNIIYNNYLTILLADTISDTANYDSSVDGSTSNDFNTGVFRQLHWFTPEKVDFYENDEIISIPYGEMLFDENDYFQNNFSSLLQNIIRQPINMGKIKEEVVNKLFIDTDLLSVDIQRGRDHGIAPYWKYTKMCGYKTIKSFKNLHPLISHDNIFRLSRIYKSARDIDLYIGGGLERKNCDDIIGPTMKCLTKLQFQRYKNGDRFFYTNKNLPHSLPQHVIKNIKSITFSTILCSTTGIKFVPKNAFLIPSPNNKFINCSEILIKDFISTLKM